MLLRISNLNNVLLLSLEVKSSVFQLLDNALKNHRPELRWRFFSTQKVVPICYALFDYDAPF